MSPTTQTVEYIVRADAPAQLEPGDPRTPALADVSRSDVVLFDLTSSTRLELETAILTMSLDRSIDGASVFKATVLDQDGTLIQHPLFRRSSDGLFYARTVLDSLVFHLVGVGVGPRRVELTFEEQPYNALRRHDKPLHGSRGKYTRAQFIKRMCDEAGVELVSPELTDKQKIAKQSASQKNTSRQPGISAHAKITVAGKPASQEQLHNMETVLSVARQQGAGEKATVALVEACIVEPGQAVETGFFTNPTVAHDHTSRGILQLLDSTARGLGISQTDVAACAKAFLTKGFWGKGGAIALAKAHPDWTAGQVAQNVQGSAYPTRYDLYKKDAEAIVAAYAGGSDNVFGVLSTDADQYTVAYEFSRGQNGQKEDSITCIRRLADEVAWYFFVSAGKAYYASGEYLLRSRARMLVEPHGEGIEGVAFQLDESSKYQDQIVVTCRAARWQAPPGSVAEVSGYGPADGRWLIGSINRPKMAASNVTQITLVRAKHKKAEPAHETRQTTSSSSNVQVTGGVDATGLSVSGGTIRQRVLSIAKKAAELSANDPNYYYYNTNHFSRWKDDVFARDSRPADRSDCSSFVIQVYAKALGGYENLPAALRHQGFTGSLADLGHKTSTPHVGDICLYGSYPYHHVELYVGDGRTIGHGSPPIDGGTPHMMSDFAGYWTFDFLDEPTGAEAHPRT